MNLPLLIFFLESISEKYHQIESEKSQVFHSVAQQK